MTEPGPLPLLAWGETTHANADARRRRRLWRHARKVLASASLAVGSALVIATIIAPPLPRVVWNASASAPIGLYAVSPGAPLARGDMVIAWAPPAARLLAARRHYLPFNVPLVKRVRAVPGDRICAVDRRIIVAGMAVATRHRRDAAGRPMPWWRGCLTLRRDALLLLIDAPASFDGRYFGVTQTSDVIGKATLLWVR